jgi:predicted permease
MLSSIKTRLRSLLRKSEMERELNEELQYHIEQQTEQNIRLGMSPGDARQAALKHFGGVEQAKERSRDARGVRWLEELWQDLRFGARMMRKAPGSTAVAVLALALGIGVNTAILSAANGFVIRPLPVETPDQLVVPFWGRKSDGEVWGTFSYMNYVDLRDRNTSLSGLLAWQMTSAGISDSEGRNSGDGTRADVVWGELVSSNYFDVLGVKPILGRGFLPEENRTQNTHPVVVLGHALWQRRFNSDSAILGKTIFLNGSPFTVIGIAPATFKGLEYAVRQDFWAPLMMHVKFGGQTGWETSRGWAGFVALMGRLKPGVTVAQADADLKQVANNLAQSHPKENAGTTVRVVSEFDGRFENVTWVFKLGSLLALCVSCLVLLVACANVANLMLARAAARSREIGIRLAIGAGRFRIVRQLLTESTLLALLGGALGWVFAYWGTALVEDSFPPFHFTIDLNLDPDLYVLKWMFGVTLCTGVIFGLAPALLASRSDLIAVLKSDLAGGSQNRRRWNLRGPLVVAQVAISVFVLICAGLFLRSLNRTLNLHPGFSTENLVTMTLDPSMLGYDTDRGKRFYAELLKRIDTQPGVRAVSLTSTSLLPGDSGGRIVLKEGEPDPPPNEGLWINCNIVAPRYFEALKIPLVLGRDFTERDSSDAPLVAIVNQEYARKFYGGEQNALGKRIRFWNTQTPLIEIVGVARDALYKRISDTPMPFFYLPLYQQFNAYMTLLVSANAVGDVPPVVENVRREIERLDSRVPIFDMKIGEQNLSYAYWGPRLAAGTATAFGLLALLLATMGLYSVMTYTISLRTREIGIRMALGAQIGDVLKLIFTQGMRQVLIGLVLGLTGAFAGTRLLASLLLGVGATDPLTFAGVAILLTAVALLACWIPARRATRVDPKIALRFE